MRCASLAVAAAFGYGRAATPHAVKHARYLPGLRIFLCVVAGAMVAYGLARPDIRPVAVVKGDTITPISSWAGTTIEKENDDQEVVVYLGSVLPVGAVDVYIDDCIHGVVVNGVPLHDGRFPYCNWFDYMTLDVSEHARRGANTVQVFMHNDLGRGKLAMKPSRSSWLFRLTLGVILAAIVGFAAYVMRIGRGRASRVLVAILAVGTVLRVVHAAYTDFDTLAYDWDGHIEYMQYIADHWKLPPGDQGWEFHQQPLYYVFGGVVLWITRALHARDAFIGIMQFFSLLMSVGTLFACGWIAALLFPAHEKRAAVRRGIFLAVLATMPGAIMFASRVNNDVPTFLFASLCVAFLLHWWKTGSFDSWFLSAVMVALALLTKSSALPLLAPVGLAYFVRRETLREKLRNGLVLAVLLGIVLGGTFFVRVLIQGQDELVPVWVTSGLRVKNFPAAYYTFQPWEVLGHPFNHNWIDTHRRQFFWEYLLKSAFFGEWDFSAYFRVQAITLLTFAMALIPVGVAGIARAALRRPVFVGLMMAAFFVASLAALASFRFMHPNSSNQELRYVVFALIPIAYFLARASDIRWLRVLAPLLVAVMAFLSAWFILAAAMHSR